MSIRRQDEASLQDHIESRKIRVEDFCVKEEEQIYIKKIHTRGNNSIFVPKKGASPRFSKKFIPYVFVLPTVAILFFIVIYPMIYSFYMSLHDWRLTRINMITYIGINNYINLLRDPLFLRAIVNTLVFAGCSVSVQFVLGLGIAFLLFGELRGVRVFRSLIFTPVILAPVIIGLIWRYMYYTEGGVFTYLSNLLRIPLDRGVLNYPSWALFGVVIADVWEWTGFVALVLLAGLQGLPREPYESAQIDGASRWQLFRFITLPLLKPVILIVLLFRTIDALKVFDKVYAMTNGSPGNATVTVTFLAFQKGLRFFDMGQAASVTWILGFLIIGVTQVYIKLIRGGEDQV